MPATDTIRFLFNDKDLAREHHVQSSAGIPQVPVTTQELGPGRQGLCRQLQLEAGLQRSLPPGTDIRLSAVVYRPTEELSEETPTSLKRSK